MGGGGQQEEHSLPDSDLVEQGSFTEINIVPLVDIMLVLLVILMATSTDIINSASSASGLRVELPTGSASEDATELSNELVIVVLEDGSVVVEGARVSLTELTALLENEAAADAQRLVLVQADERAFHRQVVAVMEAAKEAGLQNLAIATQP